MVNHKSCLLHFLSYYVTNINRFRIICAIKNYGDDVNPLHFIGLIEKNKYIVYCKQTKEKRHPSVIIKNSPLQIATLLLVFFYINVAPKYHTGKIFFITLSLRRQFKNFI
jgi:hypothetical protein